MHVLRRNDYVYDYDVIMQRNGDRDRLRMFKWSVVWKIDRAWLDQGEILVNSKFHFRTVPPGKEKLLNTFKVLQYSRVQYNNVSKIA